MRRGKYDHRKAQRGQNAFGEGGRDIRSDVDEATRFDGADIETRLEAYNQSTRTNPQRSDKPKRSWLILRWVEVFRRRS